MIWIINEGIKYDLVESRLGDTHLSAAKLHLQRLSCLNCCLPIIYLYRRFLGC